MNDELLVKFLLKETDPDEDRQVNEWLSASPANKKLLAEMEVIWASSKKLASKSAVDENAAWERFKEKVAPQKTKKLTIKPLWQRSAWLQVAAVFVLIAGSWIVYSVFKTREDTLLTNQSVLIEKLPDGSEITLNKNSELTYSFNKKERLVELNKGEVFFNVSPDKEKPFTIEADDVSIRVLGTSFNVKHQARQTEVIVETGIVKVSRLNETVELRKGEKVLVQANGELKVQHTGDQLHDYYRTKQFVADNTPLWRLVEVLNEAYKVNIIISDPKIRNLTLTATFRDESLDNILSVVGQTLNISVQRQGNRIMLR